MAVKLQLACFERLGAPGWSALEAVAAHARARGLLVIADGKRGDIAVSAAAYAQALFGGTRRRSETVPGLGADLATVNPLMGTDAIEPFVTAARARRGRRARARAHVQPGCRRRRGPGARGRGDGVGAAGRRSSTSWARAGVGEAGLSDVGAVVGATAPRHLARAARADAARAVPAARASAPRAVASRTSPRRSRPGGPAA